MIKQSQKNSCAVKFADGAIATLQIPLKLRLKTENERLAVRILACDYRQYKLMSQFGRISSRFPADDLNEVDNRLIETVGGSILIELEYQAGKEVIVPFSTAVARENSRGSITNAQRASRATATLGSRSRPAIVRDEELISSIATATDAVSSVADVLANSPVRRSRQQLEPEPIKRTRKRKAAENVGEVDLGPRKLRSRK